MSPGLRSALSRPDKMEFSENPKRVGSGRRKAFRVGITPKIAMRMRKVLQLAILAVVCTLLSATTTQAVVAVEHNTSVEQLLNGTQPGLTVDEFLELTPKQIEKRTGQKLGFKETLVLKKAQKKIKKGLKDSGSATPKSQIIALVLVIVVGALGVHRFYLGYTLIGVIQLLTAGGCGIWWIIDLIRIITGDLGPADGSAYDPVL